MVLYFDEEVTDLQKAEEDAALCAAPIGHELESLNGVNVGCGNRTIFPYLIGTDIHSGDWELGSRLSFEANPKIRCWAHDLPFKSNSVDYIIALHILEHIPDPVNTVLSWLDMVKPGGGVGLILPDWRYSWDARNDKNIWSHRWNPTPKLVSKLYDEYWQHISKLEKINTYKWKLSFDVVLRKKGEFVPISLDDVENFPTGKQLAKSGLILHSDD